MSGELSEMSPEDGEEPVVWGTHTMKMPPLWF